MQFVIAESSAIEGVGDLPLHKEVHASKFWTWKQVNLINLTTLCSASMQLDSCALWCFLLGLFARQDGLQLADAFSVVLAALERITDTLHMPNITQYQDVWSAIFSCIKFLPGDDEVPKHIGFAPRFFDFKANCRVHLKPVSNRIGSS